MTDLKFRVLQMIFEFVSKSLMLLKALGVSESDKDDEGMRTIKQHLESIKTACRNETNYKL